MGSGREVVELAGVSMPGIIRSIYMNCEKHEPWGGSAIEFLNSFSKGEVVSGSRPESWFLRNGTNNRNVAKKQQATYAAFYVSQQQLTGTLAEGGRKGRRKGGAGVLRRLATLTCCFLGFSYSVWCCFSW